MVLNLWLGNSVTRKLSSKFLHYISPLFQPISSLEKQLATFQQQKLIQKFFIEKQFKFHRENVSCCSKSHSITHLQYFPFSPYLAQPQIPFNKRLARFLLKSPSPVVRCFSANTDNFLANGETLMSIQSFGGKFNL